MTKWMCAFTLLAFCPLFAQHTTLVPHFTQRDGAWTTDLSLTNPTGAATEVTLTAYGHNGDKLAEHRQWLAPAATLAQTVAELFPNLSEDRGWLHINSSTVELAGLLTFIASTGGGTASLPLFQSAATGLFFPQLEHHGTRQSGLVLTNTASEAATVTVHLTEPNGRRHRETLTLAGHAKWVGMVADLLPNQTPARLTAEVSADQPLAGFALTFQDAVSQIFAVPAQAIDNREREQWRRAVQEHYEAAEVRTGLMSGYRIGDAAPVVSTAGVANIEQQSPLRADTPAEIGSITKSFVAAVLLQLQEEGRLDLDQPVSNFLDNIPQGDVITTRMMLNHTSGLTDYTNKEEFEVAMQAAYFGTPMWTVDEIIAFGLGKGLDFEPGADYSYSNTGYLLAGKIAEQVSGLPLDQLIRERLLDPLGMRNTFLGGHETLPYRATPYFYLEEDQALLDVTEVGLGWASAAGGLVSTCEDMMIWAKALFEGDVLQSQSLEQMLTPSPQSGDIAYGLGIRISEVDGIVYYNHTGGTFGGLAWLVYVPEKKAAFSVIANVDEYDPAFFQLFFRALEPMFGQQAAAKMTANVTTLPLPELQ